MGTGTQRPRPVSQSGLWGVPALATMGDANMVGELGGPQAPPWATLEPAQAPASGIKRPMLPTSPGACREGTWLGPDTQTQPRPQGPLSLADSSRGASAALAVQGNSLLVQTGQGSQGRDPGPLRPASDQRHPMAGATHLRARQPQHPHFSFQNQWGSWVCDLRGEITRSQSGVPGKQGAQRDRDTGRGAGFRESLGCSPHTHRHTHMWGAERHPRTQYFHVRGKRARCHISW